MRRKQQRAGLSSTLLYVAAAFESIGNDDSRDPTPKLRRFRLESVRDDRILIHTRFS